MKGIKSLQPHSRLVVFPGTMAQAAGGRLSEGGSPKQPPRERTGAQEGLNLEIGTVPTSISSQSSPLNSGR